MNPPKMPIHIGDLMRDTGHLRALLFGAYLALLFHHWSTGSLPDDDDQLSAIARMSPAEWRKARPIIERFFKPGWRHGRVEEDLESAKQSYEARAKAGEKGGKAKAAIKQSSSIATAGPEPGSSYHLPLTKVEDSEADASGADAPIDHRKRLFNEGLSKLAKMTGKGPDACRSFVGKCLKAASDDAIVVLGLIEDAERNQTVDPSAWIAARLKPVEIGNGKAKPGIIQAADDLCRKIASFDGPESQDIAVRDTAGAPATRLLSHR
jgi:uncharacterized protein YdaU (DUF1376 family)